MCRDGIRRTKIYLEFNLIIDLKGNRKAFHKCISSKGKWKENICPLLNRTEDLVARDMEK